MNVETPFRFPRCARLRASADYQAVFGGGIRFSSPCFRLHVLPRDEPSGARLGIAVSKRVDKRSPGRNRIKRQVRESFRLQRASLPNVDLVFVGKPPAATASRQSLRGELDGLLQRVRALPPVDAAGTMPALAAADTARIPDEPNPS